MKKILNNIIRLIVIISIFSVMIKPFNVYAASASITASKTTATVGDKVTITVKVTAGAWNLSVKGSGVSADKIVGYDMDQNKTTTKTYTLNTSKAGTYTITLTGDITDYDTEKVSNISKSVTVTVKAKTTTNTTTNNNNNKTNNTTKKNTQTQTKPVEVVSEITRFEVVGYDINFNKDIHNYEINVDENLKKLYIIVEGKNITTEGNKEVDISDKDEIVVKIKDTKETKEYNIKINKKSNVKEVIKEKTEVVVKEKKTNNVVYIVSTIILAAVVIFETIYIIRKRSHK